MKSFLIKLTKVEGKEAKCKEGHILCSQTYSKNIHRYLKYTKMLTEIVFLGGFIMRIHLILARRPRSDAVVNKINYKK